MKNHFAATPSETTSRANLFRLARGAAALSGVAVLLAGCAHSPMRRHPAAGTTIAPGLYVNGDPQMNSALELVRSATTSIDIEIYEMEDASFIEAVRDAVRRNVRVRIIKDPYPVPKKDQCLWFPGLKDRWFPSDPHAPESNDHAMSSCEANALPMIEEIKATKTALGGDVVPFSKPNLCGQDETPVNPQSPGAIQYCFEHGKIIIVDGSAALVSTGNFNPDNFCDAAEAPNVCNRDFSYFQTDSVAVGALESVFENDFKQARYSLHPLAIPSDGHAQVVTVSPYSLDPLVQFIHDNGTGPGHLIQVENQYLKEPHLNQALQDAAASGATVQIMVSSLCAFGDPSKSPTASTDWSKEHGLYQGFLDAFSKAPQDPQNPSGFHYFPSGLKVQGTKGYLHAKAIVIDGNKPQAKAWVGSVNGSNSALNVNREFGTFFSDSASIQPLSATLASDFAAPEAENFDQSWACQCDRAQGAVCNTPEARSKTSGNPGPSQPSGSSAWPFSLRKKNLHKSAK